MNLITFDTPSLPLVPYSVKFTKRQNENAQEANARYQIITTSIDLKIKNFVMLIVDYELPTPKQQRFLNAYSFLMEAQGLRLLRAPAELNVHDITRIVFVAVS